MAQFPVPKSPARSTITMSVFQGADFTNSPGNVSLTQSPNCINMIRDVPGKVRKCMGYKKIEEFSNKSTVNGYHRLVGSEYAIIHCGTNFILCTQGGTHIDGGTTRETVLTTNANNAKSHSWQFGESLYIQDGIRLYKWDGGKSIQVVSEIEDDVAYIPTVSIATDPMGGGQMYEDVNLLGNKFKQLFYSEETSTEYHLLFTDLSENYIKVRVLDDEGNWVEKTKGSDYTVDFQNGVIHFLVAPGKSPVEGEDNVEITAAKEFEGYADRINNCTIGYRYGVNGGVDYLFVSGNDSNINYDWFCSVNDPTYWPDTNYSVIGSSESRIMGYTTFNGKLATFKDDEEPEMNIVLREGTTLENKTVFRVCNALRGEGTISKECFGYLANEPLFLTKLGVYSIASQDITGEKYGQLRSFFLNGKLLKEDKLENAFSFVYNDFYWLCINGVCYILDGLQPLTTDPAAPYSTRQFAGFYRTNVPATCMWEHNGALYFGTRFGTVHKFYTDYTSLMAYNDDEKPIEAVWETADISGNLFYKNKTFRYIAVRVMAALQTSIAIYAQKKGVWTFVKEDEMEGRYLSFGNIQFSKFTFSSDMTDQIVASKTRLKKIDKVRFRFVNNKYNEPFGLMDVGLEYVQNGNVK